MKWRIFACVILLLLSFFNDSAFADVFGDILSAVNEIKGINTDISNYTSAMKDIDGEIKNINNDIRSYLQGQYNFKTAFKEQQTWGAGADTWESVISMTGGNSSGELGQMMNELSKAFPIETSTVNNVMTDQRDQDFYALQAQTALASRSASNVDFNKIQQQIDYQTELQNEINKTTDAKEAADLQNRLQVENNLIQLSVLRQLTLFNQQQALDLQNKADTTLKAASFLGEE